MANDPRDHTGAVLPMPRLSDDAVIEIHDFIAHFLDLFEARYGDQIRRCDQDRSTHDIVGCEPTCDIDDPPF